ncbi:MAG: hypothetical protein Q7T61_01090 [Caulobacter sp.]|nr:hypothetical protein [Caulobacter sp.]
MRTHEQIIEQAGGYKGLAAKVKQPEERVRFWERRKSIPAPYWMAVTEAGLATVDELLAARAMAA